MFDPDMLMLHTIKKYMDQDELECVISPRGFANAKIYGEYGMHCIVIDTPKAPPVIRITILGYLNGEHTDNPELFKALLRVNYSFYSGRFSRDDSDGEVRVECSFPVDNGVLSYEQYRHALLCLTKVADEYYPVFQRILWIPGMTADKSFCLGNENNTKESTEGEGEDTDTHDKN